GPEDLAISAIRPLGRGSRKGVPDIAMRAAVAAEGTTAAANRSRAAATAAERGAIDAVLAGTGGVVHAASARRAVAAVSTHGQARQRNEHKCRTESRRQRRAGERGSAQRIEMPHTPPSARCGLPSSIGTRVYFVCTLPYWEGIGPVGSAFPGVCGCDV